MELIFANTAALAVAVIYYSWRTYAQVQARQQGAIRERVAYMLWVMADRVGSHQEIAID